MDLATNTTEWHEDFSNGFGEWPLDRDKADRKFNAWLRHKGFRRGSTSKKPATASPKKRHRIRIPTASAPKDSAALTWEARFASKLPSRPYCADDFAFGSYRQPREVALGFRLIQYNDPERKRWQLFDLDYKDAAEAYERANVAVPNFIMENPANGHAHYAYEFATPVTYYGKSHQSPIEYLRDIERGMIRRLGADKAYGGPLAKNAAHHAWRVYRPREAPYCLGDVARWLEPGDMKGWAPGEREAGIGRNVSLFDWLRGVAYKEVLRLQRAGASFAELLDGLLGAALEMNRGANFHAPLSFGEVRGIVKSVARWTWKHFSPERFSEIQSARGVRGNAIRWAGHASLDETRPWDAEGVSRRTWFYRQKAACGQV